MPTLQEWKLARGVVSRPNIECIHRARHERRDLKHSIREKATRRPGECCVPPWSDHLHGFKQIADGQPLLVSLTYYDSTKHLEKIVSDCVEWAIRQGVGVRFSTEESWLDTPLPVVLIEWSRNRFIPAVRKCRTCGKRRPWNSGPCDHKTFKAPKAKEKF